jgi:hypothetical protein
MKPTGKLETKLENMTMILARIIEARLIGCTAFQFQYALAAAPRDIQTGRVN